MGTSFLGECRLKKQAAPVSLFQVGELQFSPILSWEQVLSTRNSKNRTEQHSRKSPYENSNMGPGEPPEVLAPATELRPWWFPFQLRSSLKQYKSCFGFLPREKLKPRAIVGAGPMIHLPNSLLEWFLGRFRPVAGVFDQRRGLKVFHFSRRGVH